MNRRNDYEQLLQYANEDLAKLGRKIVLEQDEDDGSYSVIVQDENGDRHCYAEGYYGDELAELVNDAWAHAKAMPKHKSDEEKFLELAGRLEAFLKPDVDAGTYPFADEEEANELTGCCEKLYVTKVAGAAAPFLFLHWSGEPGGDWTRALLIPEDNFQKPDDGWSQAMEGLAWFLTR